MMKNSVTHARMQIDYSVYQNTGLKHRNRKEPTQDAWIYRAVNNTIICGVADGQSGRLFSAVGASCVLNRLADFVGEVGVDGLRSYEYLDELQYEIGRMVREEIRCLADSHNAERIEFGSTFVLLAVDVATGRFASIHLGDGIILGVNNNGNIMYISSPENEIFPNSTWLSTSNNMFHHIRASFGSVDELNRILVATDGALHFFIDGHLTISARRLLMTKGSKELHDYLESASTCDDACLLDLTINRLDK